MVIKNPSYYLHRAREQKHPMRWVVSRILWRTGLCRLFTIDRGTYRLRFFPSSLSAEYWANKDERKDEEEFFRAYLRPGDTVVDVGANVGALSLAASVVVGESGRVFAIEPHPMVFGYLSANIKLNGRGNITPFNTALGDTPGRICFSDLLSDDCNEIVVESKLSVPVTTLDSLLPDRRQRLALLKVDVEGYEKFVFAGGADVLARTDCLYFEVWEMHCAKYGYSSVDLLNQIRSSGFSILQLDNNRTVNLISGDYRAANCVNLIAVRDVVDFCTRSGFRFSNNNGAG